MQPINIPQYVDDPPHLLFWQADEIAPIGIGLVLGCSPATQPYAPSAVFY